MLIALTIHTKINDNNNKEDGRKLLEIGVMFMALMLMMFHRCISSVQFSHSDMSDYLQPYGLQHSRLPCPALTPEACSNSCPLSQWCHPTISSSVIPFSSCLSSIFPSLRVFSNESVLCIRWPVYWSFSFSISLSSEYSGLISLRMDWLALFAVQGRLESLLQHHSSEAPALNFLYSPTLASVHDYWKNHGFD